MVVCSFSFRVRRGGSGAKLMVGLRGQRSVGFLIREFADVFFILLINKVSAISLAQKTKNTLQYHRCDYTKLFNKKKWQPRHGKCGRYLRWCGVFISNQILDFAKKLAEVYGFVVNF